LDVDGDRQVTPKDLLAIISYLNGYGATDVPTPGILNGRLIDVGRPFGFIGVTRDNIVAPNDIVAVIIHLNGYGAGEGESESPAVTNAPPTPLSDDLLYLLSLDVVAQSKRGR